MKSNRYRWLPRLALGAVLGLSTLARALPVELKDQNNTSYFINTQVSPLLTLSDASGAVANATYINTVTVTSTFVGFSTFFGGESTFTVQRTVNVPLRNAFAGFQGFAIAAAGNPLAKLPQPLVYNPGSALAGEECSMNGKNRQLDFAPQDFPSLNLQLSRKVFVSTNGAFVRWINVVTNTASTPQQVGIGLRGLLGSMNQTKITATSTGDSSLTTADQWFTTAQAVAQGTTSTVPRIGYLFQGPNPTLAPHSVTINSLGQAGATWTPTSPAGGSAIIMNFATVQGNNKQAKNTMTNLVSLPSNSLHCLSEQELSQIVNFEHITPPQLKSATLTLKFNKTGADTIQWKGKIQIAAGINLNGLPVTVDVGSVTQSFVLNKSGKANNGGNNKFALNASINKGLTKAGTPSFSFHLQGSFQEALASYGMTNAAASKAPITVPVTLTAGPGTFEVDQGFTYNATASKSGTAKAS